MSNKFRPRQPTNMLMSVRLYQWVTALEHRFVSTVDHKKLATTLTPELATHGRSAAYSLSAILRHNQSKHVPKGLIWRQSLRRKLSFTIETWLHDYNTAACTSLTMDEVLRMSPVDSYTLFYEQSNTLKFERTCPYYHPQRAQASKRYYRKITEL